MLGIGKTHDQANGWSGPARDTAARMFPQFILDDDESGSEESQRRPAHPAEERHGNPSTGHRNRNGWAPMGEQEQKGQ